MAARNLAPIDIGQPPRPNPFTTPSTIDLPPNPLASEQLINGILKTENTDGSATFDFAPKKTSSKPKSDDFYRNLADEIDSGEIDRISAELIIGIASDDQSRREWLETRARGIQLLGLKLNDPKGEATSEGVSTIQHPLLLEATLRFQANARGELLPASGPVKIRNDATVAPKLPPPPPMMLPQPPPAPMGHNGGPPMGMDNPMPPMPNAAGGPPLPVSPIPPGPQGPPLPPPPVAPPTGMKAPPSPVVPGGMSTESDLLAQALEKDFNHFLTAVATEYYPDTDRMLFWVGAGGLGIKKVYNCPIRQRPVSESVDAENLIVSDATTDLENCGRVTHRIKMRPSQLKRMQLIGAYLDIELPSAPTYTQPNAVEVEKNEIQSVKPQPQQPQDADHEIYECYCELNIEGFEHKKKGKETGLQLPYVVTIHKESRKILQVRRNWNEDDEQCIAKPYFVDFAFVRAIGFYAIGLINILGNTTSALTAAWRIILDSGMFSNFPGFVYQKQFGRQLTSDFRIPPGGGIGLDTGGMPINQAVMPLPYHEATAGFTAFIAHMEEVGQRVGSTAEMNIGEGKQDAPVGTTLALIEQATKMMDAVHKRLHSAQAKEFQLLKERFKEDPEAFWRYNNHPAMPWQKEQFLSALKDCNIVPVSDPNNPTSMHRIAKAAVIKTLQQGSPQLYDPIAVDERIMRIAGIDPEGLFRATPADPPPDPSMVAAQAKAKSTADANQLQMTQMALKFKIAQIQSQDKAQDRESRERIEELKLAQDRLDVIESRIIHGDQNIGAGEDVNAQVADVLKMLVEHQGAIQQRDHEVGLASQTTAESARQADIDRQEQRIEAERQRQHDAELAAADREHKAQLAREAHAAKIEAVRAKPVPKPSGGKK